jgi:tyrosine-protein phosphatase SIW14
MALPINFSQVTQGIFRGGHPDNAALDTLKGMGIISIVDLEVDDLIEALPWQILQEVHGTGARGITLLRFPISAFEAAISPWFDKKINSILAVLADSKKKPLYVHCKHGQDRTGLVIGLERVLLEGWSPSRAYAEMLKIGFHPDFLGLKDYFWRKTATPLALQHA